MVSAHCNAQDKASLSILCAFEQKLCELLRLLHLFRSFAQNEPPLPTTRIKKSTLRWELLCTFQSIRYIMILNTFQIQAFLIRIVLAKLMVARKSTGKKEFTCRLAMVLGCALVRKKDVDRKKGVIFLIFLGMRFALMQMKAALVELIRNYEVTVNKKTKVPFVYDPANFLLMPLGGIWVDFKPIWRRFGVNSLVPYKLRPDVTYQMICGKMLRPRA